MLPSVHNLPCDCSNESLHGCLDHWVTRACFLQLPGEKIHGRRRSYDQQRVQRSWSGREGSKSQPSGACQVMYASRMARKKNSGCWFKVDQSIYEEYFQFWVFLLGGGDFCGKIAEKRLALALVFEITPRGKFLKCDDREKKAERGWKQRYIESWRAIQIRKACTAVKYSCAGSHSELNWHIIRGKH